MGPANSPDELHRALRDQEAWVRRLARALARQPHDAEDLAQDVLAAALRDAPYGRGQALRAWLGAAARRLAAQGGQAGRARAECERRAARPEVVAGPADADAEAQLELQRRLVAALGELEPTYRTAVVLRYLEGLPPREIARRLDISSGAARQRIARGLVRLRARLGSELRERRDLLAVFVVLARAPQQPLPLADAALIDPVLLPRVAARLMPSAYVVKSLVSFGAALALACLAWLVVPTPRHAAQPRPGLAHPTTELGATDGDAGGVRSTSATLAEATAPEGERTPVAAADVPATDGAPRLHVVDPHGAPAFGARAAWVDRTGEVRELVLDAASSATLPHDSAGTQVFARSDAFALGVGTFGDLSEDVIVTLAECAALRGRVTVDGGVPAEPVRLTLEPATPLLRADCPWPQRARERLVALGFEDQRREAWCDGAGRFEFPGLHPLSSGALITDGSYQVPGTDIFGVGYEVSKGEELLLDLTRRAHVEGRVLWADDRTPVAGDVRGVWRTDEEAPPTINWGRLALDGRFALCLPEVVDRLVAGGSVARLAIEVRASNNEVLHSSVEFGIDETPGTRDVGTLHLTRPARLPILVLGPSEIPIPRAWILIEDGRARADDAGRADIAEPADGWIQVLAPGFAVADLEVRSLARDAEGLAVVRLTPGRTLRVSLLGCEPPDGQDRPNLMLKFDEDPFEMTGRSSDAAGILKARSAALFAFLGEAVGESSGHVADSGGHITFVWQGDQPLVVPGLRAGARFELGLQSVIEDELVLRRMIDVPETPGMLDIVLEPRPGELVGLEVRVLDAQGTPIPKAGRLIKRPGAPFYDVLPASGWPFPDGTLTVLASAPGYVQQKVEVDARAVAPAFDIELRRGREVSVRTLDESDRPLRPEKVALLVSGQRLGAIVRGTDASASGCPLERGEVEVVVGGRATRVPIDAEETEVTVRLPLHGTLRVTLAQPPMPAGRAGEWFLAVRLPEGGTAEVSRIYLAEDRRASTLELPLLPGSYVVEVRAQDRGGARPEPTVLHVLDVDVIADEVTERSL